MLPILAAAAVLYQASAAAPPPAPRPSVILHPDWAARATAKEVAEAYPKAAADVRADGRAVAHCTVNEAGDLVGCVASAEDPPALGLGAAVVSLAPKFRMRTLDRDGEPVAGAAFDLAIRFRPPAPPLPPGVRLITHPKWLARPSGPEISRYFPERAQRQNVPGDSILQCRATADGHLDSCEIISEYPKDYGFAAGTLALSPFFQLEPTDGDGQPVEGGAIRIPFNWLLPN